MSFSPRPLKRKRSGPPTPPTTITDPDTSATLDRAVNVLSVEATALSHVTRLYQTEPVAREGLLQAIEAVVRVNERGGKLIVSGVGKSALIGKKTVATMKSLGLGCSFMHAGEAMHGDLGDIRENDALLFITFSGRTPELTHLLPHIPPTTPLLLLTSHTHPSTCPLAALRPDAILLPGPVHESEEASFGVAAPTTSTAVAMAVGDMLALAAAAKVHGEGGVKSVFHGNHPGGAIGVKARLGVTVQLGESDGRDRGGRTM